MSKHEWVELPNWLDPDAYLFLKKASIEEWTWEVLRRNPDYRADWARQQALQDQHGAEWRKHPDAMIYSPPKREDEDDQVWLRRCVADEAEPVAQSLSTTLGKKWGLDRLYNPRLPFSQGVRFRAGRSATVRQIHTATDFQSFLQEETCEVSGWIGEHVADRYVVFAIDLSEPVGSSLNLVKSLIQVWKAKLKQGGRLPAQRAGRLKYEKWERHLRVLDARRMTPPAKYREIGAALHSDFREDAAPKSDEEIGGKYVEQAACLQKGYRMMLA